MLLEKPNERKNQIQSFKDLKNLYENIKRIKSLLQQKFDCVSKMQFHYEARKDDKDLVFRGYNTF